MAREKSFGFVENVFASRLSSASFFEVGRQFFIKIRLLLMTVFCLVILVGGVGALSMPLAVSGTVYDADTGQQISERVHISVNNTNSGYYAEGMTGTFYNPGKFSAGIFGGNGDEVIIRVWNKHHEESVVVVLSGSMYGIELYLNMTPIVGENRPPKIISEPLVTAFVNVFYRYDVEAEDPDNDVLEYRLLKGPNGMSIDAHTGLIEWVPRIWQIGRHNIAVEVDDGRGGKDVQEFVLRARLPPWFNSKWELAHYLNLSEDSSYFMKIIPFKEYEIINQEISMKSLMIGQDVGVPVVYALYGEGIEKPTGVRTAGRKVYTYMQIFSLNVESETINNLSLKFGVRKAWLDRKNVDSSDIVLLRYNNGQWYPRETRIVGEDELNYYYEASADGIGHFAIVERNGRTDSGRNVEAFPFFVVGTIFRADGSQVDEGTSIVIENLKTKERVNLASGIGPMSGAYAVIIPGTKDDNIMITIDGTSRYSFKLKEKENQIDFVRKRFGQGYSAKVIRGGEDSAGLIGWLFG